MVHIHVHASSALEAPEANSLLVFHVQGTTLSAPLQHLDQALGGELSAILADGEWTGKKSQVAHVRIGGRLSAQHLYLVGLGEADKLTSETVRQAAGTAARHLRGPVANVVLDAPEHARATVEGLLMGLYTFKGYKSDAPDAQKEEKRLRQLTILSADNVDAEVEAGRIAGEAVCYARDLINERANLLHPLTFAERAVQTGEAAGLHVEVLDEQQLQELGMNLLLAVGKGSDIPPRLVILRYNGAPESQDVLGIVGKGVTYDTGGYIIKPETGMGDMHTDMGGAACVLAAMKALAERQLPINVIGVLCLAENMISGRAFKPGDIAVAFNGKTVELIDTDCEGRLVLADGIAYVKHLGATKIVDTATLTGAVTVALGREAASLFGNDESFLEQVQQAGAAVGEKLFPLPNYPEYQSLIESTVADYINYSGRNAAAIAGGVFLTAFADDVPFVHIDMANMSTVKSTKGYQVEGATAFSTRTLLALAEQLVNK